jgi:hypothetical protein
MTDEQPSPTARNIPLPMQREIRQRCGFGCVVCGLPLYDYDHLLGWATVQRHAAAEITLLCGQHHREKGAGLLPAATVDAANRYLHYSGDECEVVLGGNTFSAKDGGYGTVLLPISVDDTPLLAFILGDGHLMLNLNLFDQYNNLVLQIKNNQLIQAISPWDIQLIGRNLVVREAERKILVDITFEPPGRIIVRRGRFLRNGVEILIRPERIVVANNGATFEGTRMRNWPAGVLIGPHQQPMSAIFRMEDVPRYHHDRRLTEQWVADVFGGQGPA